MVIRLKDIAEDLGVSAVTVSKVLRDNPDIGPETRQRVLKRVGELNYQPNLAARSLATGRTCTIGLVVPDLLHPPFSEVTNAISSEARKRDYTLLISSSGDDPELEAQEIKRLLARRVDVIIVASVQSSPDSFRQMEDYATPLILIDRRIKGLDANFVGIDDEAAGELATEHLIEQGYRRIAHIHGPQVGSAVGRMDGYLRALRHHHLAPSPEYIVSHRISGDNLEKIDGYVAALHLLTLNPRPDAVFCFDDISAIGAMQAIFESGLRIPDDLAVVGCGNLPYADLLRVPLTSVDRESESIGKRTASLALRIARVNRRVRPKIDIIAPRIVIRESSLRVRWAGHVMDHFYCA